MKFLRKQLFPIKNLSKWYIKFNYITAVKLIFSIVFINLITSKLICQQLSGDTNYITDTLKLSISIRNAEKLEELRNYSEAKKIAKEAKLFAEKIKSPAFMVRILVVLARVSDSELKNEEALEYYKEALALNVKDDNAITAKLMNDLGLFYKQIGHNEKALEYLLEAIKINEKTRDLKRLAANYNNLGIVFAEQENYQKGLEYYFKSIKIKQDLGNTQGIIHGFNNMGNIYIKLKDYQKALYYYFEANKLNVNIENIKSNNASFYKNIADVYYRQGYYAKALPFHKKAYKQYKELGYKERCGSNLISLGKDYIGLNKLDSANFCLIDALSFFERTNDKIYLKEIYQYFALLNAKRGNYKNAYNYRLLLADIKDSLFDEKTQEIVHEKNMKYEADKKDRAIENLNNEKEKILLENKLKTAQQEKRTILLFYATISFGILLFLTYGYTNIKRWQKRQKQFTAQLIHSQEEERKRISKELHDGIGQNLLTLKNSYNINMPLMESTIEDLNNISRNMHPVLLEKLGLIKAVESVINEAKETTKIMFSYELHEVNDLLTQSQQINLFRIVQESLRNIIKHSQTTAAKITILKDGDKIITSIYDKGKGFDIKEARNKKSLGLTSITERVALIGGKLNITSNTSGTRIEIILKNG